MPNSGTDTQTDGTDVIPSTADLEGNKTFTFLLSNSCYKRQKDRRMTNLSELEKTSKSNVNL